MNSDLPVMEFALPRFHSGLNTTVRRGRRWHGVRAARLRLVNGQLSAPVELVTELKAFRSLDVHALRCQHDPHCRTPQGLLARLQALYPGFSEDEIVTV